MGFEKEATPLGHQWAERLSKELRSNTKAQLELYEVQKERLRMEREQLAMQSQKHQTDTGLFAVNLRTKCWELHRTMPFPTNGMF